MTGAFCGLWTALLVCGQWVIGRARFPVFP